MPSARKSAPPKTQAKAKRTAVPHGPSEGKGKPAASKAPAKVKTAPAKKASATRTTRGGAAASKPAQVAQRAERPVSREGMGDAGSTPAPGTNLNPKQRAFVAEYLKDRNAAAAYTRVYGVAPATAETAGPRLFRNVQVRAEIDRIENATLAKVQQETGITLERTLREIARIGYFDPRRMFKPDGTPLGVHELDDATAAVVAGLEVLEAYEGTGEDRRHVGQVKKWKLADKKGALDMLLKHLGGYKADNDQAGEAAAKALAGLTVRFVEPGQT